MGILGCSAEVGDRFLISLRMHHLKLVLEMSSVLSMFAHRFFSP